MSGSPRYRPTDLVRIGEAGPSALHAEVIGTSRTNPDRLRRGRLEVRQIGGARVPRATREVRVGEVTAHWRRVR